jgi:hypothetical protein
MANVDTATVVYSYFFVVAGLFAGGAVVFRHYLNRAIHEKLEPLLDLVNEMDKRTSRIEYALYNDGKTGLINKVDSIVENQQIIKTDVEVMKARNDG